MSTRREDDTYTHTLLLRDGTEICVRADHGTGYVDVKRPGSRVWATNRVEPHRMSQFGRRCGEIADVAPSTMRRA